MSAENSGARGRPFEKGKSPNPGGRPKGYAEFKAMCRKRTKRAIRALVSALGDPDTRVSAAKALLEFGWGKPHQSVDVEHSGGFTFTLKTNARGPLRPRHGPHG